MQLRRPVLCSLALALGCLLAPSAASAATAVDQRPGHIRPAAPAAPHGYVPGRVVVRYEAGTTAAARAETRSDAGTDRLRGLGMAQTEVVRVADGDSVPATVAQLRRDPDVELASPDRIAHTNALPGDPQLPREWGLDNTAQGLNFFGTSTNGGNAATPPLAGADIDASSAWDTVTGSDTVVVAVMDGGIDYELPDLAPEIWKNPGETGGDKATNGVDDDGNGFVDDWQGYDFVGASHNAPTPDNDPFDEQFHGTHVAGTIGARGGDGTGVTGVTQRVRLMNVRHTDSSGSGVLSTTVGALNYAGAMGADVANGSFGFTGLTTPASRQLVSDAITSHPGTLYVFSAGNGGSDSIGDNLDAGDSGDDNVLPCELPAANVICVAATDQADRLARFSNYGATSVDLGAPGVDILSDWARATYFQPVGDTQAGFDVDWPPATRGDWGRLTAAPFGNADGAGIADSPGGNYDASKTNVATSRSFTIPAGATGCEVTYFRRIALGAGDSGKMEVFRDGTTGAVASTITYSPTNNGAASSFITIPDPGTAGTYTVSLTLTSDAATQADGLAFANMHVDCDPRKGQPGSYQYLNGTSMAAPHVTGAAALLLAADPTLTVAGLRTALLTSGDPIPALAGKTVTGRRLDVASAIASLTPGSGGGPGPGGDTAVPPGGAGTGPAATTVSGAGAGTGAPALTLGLGGLPATLQLDKRGSATVAVTASPGTAGTLSVRTAKPLAAAAAKGKKPKKKILTLARKAFTVPAAGRTTVTFRVSGKALRTLKKAKRLASKIEITAGGRTVSRPVSIKAPKAKKKKR